MKILFENRALVLEQAEDGDYRITFFNEDSRWHGDFIFNKHGIFYDNLTEREEL